MSFQLNPTKTTLPSFGNSASLLNGASTSIQNALANANQSLQSTGNIGRALNSNNAQEAIRQGQLNNLSQRELANRIAGFGGVNQETANILGNLTNARAEKDKFDFENSQRKLGQKDKKQLLDYKQELNRNLFKFKENNKKRNNFLNTGAGVFNIKTGKIVEGTAPLRSSSSSKPKAPSKKYTGITKRMYNDLSENDKKWFDNLENSGSLETLPVYGKNKNGSRNRTIVGYKYKLDGELFPNLATLKLYVDGPVKQEDNNTKKPKINFDANDVPNKGNVNKNIINPKLSDFNLTRAINDVGGFADRFLRDSNAYKLGNYLNRDFNLGNMSFRE